MRIVILIAVALLIISSNIDAKTVQSATASTVAKNFYNQHSPNQVNFFTLSYTEKTAIGDTVLYFIFNVDRNNGWIAVSADNATIPILGYSFSGHFESGTLPPEFSFWMEGYKNQILSVKRNALSPTVETESKWQSYLSNNIKKSSQVLSSVNPLLSTTWSQGQYYNAKCPNGSPTGCVATAMAQIMKYWNYPTLGTGSHSYGSESADFGSTVYHWADMPNALTSSNDAVATLMYHCGVSVEMQYGPKESGAWIITDGENHPYSAEHAYPTYFGYNSSTIQGLKKDNYSNQDWMNSILKPELNNGRPVQYGGWDPSTGAGHSWVCDGYDADNYFHMNWGWGGISDCYVTLDEIHPYSSTYHFKYSQQAIIGIKPNLTCVDNFEPNDNSGTATLVFAQPLNDGNSNYTPQGNIGWSGDQDWYKVNIGREGTLTINLTNLPYDYDLELYGPSGLNQWISGSYNGGANSEQIIYPYTGSSTTVYAKVYPSPKNPSAYTTSSCYNLQFIWTPTTSNLPDLYISSPGANSSTVNAGGSLTVTSTVANSGPGSAGASDLGYYFSNSCYMDGSSILLGHSAVGALAAQATSPQSQNINIPSGAIAGLHYILFIADDNGSVNEGNEANNIVCLPITVLSNSSDRPNLTCQSGSAGTKDNLAIYQCVVLNNGVANAGSFFIKYYVCTGSSFTNPIWVGEDYVSQGLAINETYTSNFTVDLCFAGLTTGSYYLGFFVDYDEQVNESNEDDNNNLFSFRALPINCSVNCQYQIAPNNASFIFGGGSNWTNVTCNNSCSWNASSPDSWITVLNTNGVGPATIHYEVSTNSSPSSRTGHINISGQVYEVNQDGKNCPSSVDPLIDTVAAEGGDYSFHYSVNPVCGYGFYITELSWITITSTPSNSLVSYHVSANPGDPRMGAIIVDTAHHYIYQKSNIVPGWKKQTSGITDELTSVDFVDQNIGWTVGRNSDYSNSSSVILKTTNGGTIWQSEPSRIGGWLFALDFYNHDVGWVVGQNGAIFKTTTGGTNWTIQPTGTMAWLYGVDFIDQNIGWAVGSSGTVLHTTDGGTSWTAQRTGQFPLMVVSFIDQNIGWVLGQDGRILHTVNGGNNWADQSIGDNEGINSVKFIDSNIGWLTSSENGYGAIFKTTNGGSSWVRQFNGSNFLLSIDFLDQTNGWAVGFFGTILQTTNGGENWVGRSGVTDVRLNAVTFSQKSGWAVGASGTILKIDNGGVTFVSDERIEPPNQFILFQNYPNPYNPTTELKYALPTEAYVRISIYNTLGQVMATLVDRVQTAGSWNVMWVAGSLTSGIYFYRLDATSISDPTNHFSQTRKMILVK